MSANRKLERARRKAEKARLRLVDIEQRERAATATHFSPAAPPGDHAQGARPRRSRAWRRLVIVAAVVVVVAAAGVGAWAAGVPEKIRDRLTDADSEAKSAQTSVEDVRGAGRAIVIRDGAIGPVDLAAALAAGGADGLVGISGNVATVGMPIVVEAGGTFEVRDLELRLLSNSSQSTFVEVRGGRLDVQSSTITSWDDVAGAPDEEPKDGRASVLVTAGGSADVEDSTLSALGYEETDRHGFSFTGGSTSGTVRNTRVNGGRSGFTVSGNLNVSISDVDVRDVQFAGIELAGTSGVDVTDSTVQGSDGDGIVVIGASSDIAVRGNDVFGNKGTGLALLGSGGKIDVTSNYSHRNARAGVTVSNTRDANVAHNKVWGNGVGVSLVGGNSGTVIRDNQVSGNKGAGVESTSAGNTVLIAGNVIDHNEHGVVIADGTIEVRGNTISDNTWGVAVLDKSPRAIVRDNTVTNSADGAIRLVKHDGLEIKGNTLNVNRMAPFIVDVAGDSLSYQDSNDFQGGRKGSEWVYEPMRDIGELAVLTPVPAEFFTQPNVQFLIPEDLAQAQR